MWPHETCLMLAQYCMNSLLPNCLLEPKYVLTCNWILFSAHNERCFKYHQVIDHGETCSMLAQPQYFNYERFGTYLLFLTKTCA